LALVTGLVFGTWPALGATRGDATTAIKSGGGHGATAGTLGRARRALVVAEVALTVMLLVGAGLMLRSFATLMSESIGMDPARVATARLSFPRGTPLAERSRVIDGVVEELSRQPGIVSAGVVNNLPFVPGGISVGLT